MKYILPILFLSCSLFGQSLRLDQNSRYNHFIDRLDILYGGLPGYSTAIKNHDTKALAIWLVANLDELLEIDKSEARHFLNQYNFQNFEEATRNNTLKDYVDSSNVFYTINEEEKISENIYTDHKPILKYFFKNPHHFYSLNTRDLQLRLDPIFDISSGYAKDDTTTVFRNTRGVRINGYIDDKIYFHTEIVENQARFNNYVEDYINEYNAIPGYGLYKDYKSSIIKKLNGHDFLTARGYVGLPISKSVSIELGHSNHLIGNGIRSLLLSDFSNSYFYLKFNTRVWKLNYQNIFAELNAVSPNGLPGDQLVPKKYMANHFLSIALRKNLEIGLFETVIFSRENHFEFQYLNPIILYRFVEHSIGSPDNVILGTNFKWNPFKGISLYGQFALDEFNTAFLNQSDWWANKYAVQGGIKYLNILGINQLDGQAEVNIVRPYTYSHGSSIEALPNQSVSNYSHNNLTLAHPLGSNFKEFMLSLRYRPSNRLLMAGRINYAQKGLDEDGKNYGGNILTTNESRVDDYGIVLLQGNVNTIKTMVLNVQYEIFKNFYLDLNCLARNSSYEEATLNDKKTLFIGLGLRANMAKEEHNF